MEYAPVRVSTPPNDRLPDGGRVLPQLTERQREVLTFIYRYSNSKRLYPTAVEVGAAFDFSPQAARSVFEALIKKGYAFKQSLASNRSLRLTEAAVEKLKMEGEGDGQASLPGI